MSDLKYRKARKRVKTKKEFYEHFTIYVVMCIFFIGLNLFTYGGSWWFFWPIMGWGLGVLFHYLDAFGIPGVGTMSEEWEEKAILEEMERLEWQERKGQNQSRTSSDTPVDFNDTLELKELERLKQQPRWDEDELV